MFRIAVRTMTVSGLVLAPLFGAVAGASAEGTQPSTSGSQVPAARLEYFVSQDGLLEAGDAVSFSVEGMPRGWDRVTVTSPALVEPGTLVPGKKGSTRSAQAGSSHVRAGLRAGTYPVTATSHGRVVATARLKVAAKGSAVIGRFVISPKDAIPGRDSPARVRPGSEVVVVLTDHRAAPGEESLTVTSPVFDEPLTIRTDSEDDPGCKCDDGATLWAGHTRVRDNIPQGRYTLTVVSHHGQQTTRQDVTVAGEPVTHGRPWVFTGAVVAGVLVLIAGGAVARLRRAHTAAASARAS